jgi:hypothetical protein
MCWLPGSWAGAFFLEKSAPNTQTKCFLRKQIIPLVLTEGPIWELGEQMKPPVLTDRTKGWTLGRKDCPKGRVEGGAGTKISVSAKKIVSL